MPGLPVGMTVRRFHDTVDDGPFRDLTMPTRTEITYHRPPLRGHTTARIVIWVAPPLSIVAFLVGVITGAYGALAISAALFLLFVMAVGEMQHARIPDRDQTLVLTPDALALADGKRLVLADVRRVEVTRSGGDSTVIVHTPDGPLAVAATGPPAQSRYIADEIEAAYRACLRRGS